ncbi:hypothetical protein N7478_012017 [Penicillium angulare]|uniref:uncharacterized protein n=1 Tax=Penicillium angulare TaxID=116970 RepID=UPI0025422B43|nr:uncharacterized protein N7478_012017 [Penicillium angulare]KAJ5261422.1 hypothetical protein N7478_012017 [Penicillium angulare]
MAYRENPGVASYVLSIGQRNTREVVVDHLWQRILQISFPYEENYLHEREEYSHPRSLSRANVTLATLQNAVRRKLLVVECKKSPGNRSGYAPPGVWEAAKVQLRNFLLSYRQTQAPLACGLYAIVEVGKFAKFYRLKNSSDDLEDFGGNLTTLNIERDANQVQALLALMKSEIEGSL